MFNINSEYANYLRFKFVEPRAWNQLSNRQIIKSFDSPIHRKEFEEKYFKQISVTRTQFKRKVSFRKN